MGPQTYAALDWIAIYGAIVGTIALMLNFLRYRHVVAGSKIRLKVEVVQKLTRGQLEERAAQAKVDAPYRGMDKISEITHDIKIRNLGAVTAHVEDCWIVTRDKRQKHAVRRTRHDALIYEKVSERGNVEIAPRSSFKFQVFSEEDDYLDVFRAFAVDETGKTWKSKKS